MIIEDANGQNNEKGWFKFSTLSFKYSPWVSVFNIAGKNDNATKYDPNFWALSKYTYLTLIT